MKRNDPILSEIRKFRDEHAKEFNYDVQAIGEDLMRRQRESGKQYVAPPVKGSDAPHLPLPGDTAFGTDSTRQSS